MGIEFFYAYLDNLFIPSIILGVLSLVAIIILIWLRKDNEIDLDDWIVLMKLSGTIFCFSLLFSMAPSTNHISKVKKEYFELINPKPEKPNECKISLDGNGLHSNCGL